MIAETFLVWSLAAGTAHGAPGAVQPPGGAGIARPVGSLAKAFVLEAWGTSHPESAAPGGFACGPASGCWLPAGHGTVDLVGATAVSCNAYFLAMARETPPQALADRLQRRGFDLPRLLSPEAAIGLGPLPSLPRISPRALLRAYLSLATEPWATRDDLRLGWLAGMARAAREGTGKGLGLRGLLAKTGTVPSLLGEPLATSGWALAVDPAGTSAHLALLLDGTGAGAAERLGGHLSRRLAEAARPPRDPARPVRVRLFTGLFPESIVVRNDGAVPAIVSRGGGRGRAHVPVGPAATSVLASGDRLGSGRFTLSLSPYGLERTVDGALEVTDARGVVMLTLVTTPREWAEGVVRGELPDGPPDRQEALAAAALRFLAEGPRHGSADTCDSTHCAHFVGRGPAVVWTTPTTARTLPPSRGAPGAFDGFDDGAWSRVLAAASEPGPSRFTGHCGGEPLSPRAVWGRGSDEADACPRHRGAADASPWERLLTSPALDAALGGPVTALAALERDGVRRARATVAGASRELSYDELHRLLAQHLGWDALPSPPDFYERTAAGFLARGRGRGHRVGLCLAD